jgi:hypothetical protein
MVTNSVANPTAQPPDRGLRIREETLTICIGRVQERAAAAVITMVGVGSKGESTGRNT